MSGPYRGGVRDGVWEHWYPTGEHLGTLRYEGGKAADGVATTFHPNGQKREEGPYRGGERDGLWTEWWPSGQKRREATYRGNALDGPVREWDETGKPLPDQEWRAGRRIR
jgi:hypothetical protein